MAVRIIDPISNCEITRDRDFNLWSNSSNVTQLSGFLPSIFSDIRAR